MALAQITSFIYGHDSLDDLEEFREDAYVEEALGGAWHYFAVATNINLFQKSYQEILEFYQKRGNAENFIREKKYGYDLKHFPCLKLKANAAFGSLAIVAHNLLRWAALAERPDKPHFAKKLRRRFIHAPGKLVSHARQLVLKVKPNFKKEVDRLKQALTALPLNPSLDTC